MNHTWQNSELRRYLKKNHADPLLESKSVFLSNPEQKRYLDQVITDEIFPSVQRALKGTPIRVSLGRDQDIAECIEDEWRIHTTRSLVFLLEDPDRTLSSRANIKWFCRGKIECSPFDYMISFAFHIYFPESFSLKKILKLLKDPAFAGMRPQMDYQGAMDDVGTLAVQFERGRGKGGAEINPYSAVNQIYDDVKANLDVIYAANLLEADYKSTRLFNQLHRALIDAYEAH